MTAGSSERNWRQRWLPWVFVTLSAILVGASASYAITEWLLDDPQTGSASGPPADAKFRPGFSFEDAQNYEDFSIYWVGGDFQGLALDAIYKTETPGIPGYEDVTRSEVVALSYGDCQIAWGQTGCRVPLSMTIYPYCTHPPETLYNGVKVGPPTDVRGATVQYTGASDLILWTSDVAISVHGPSPEVTKAVVENLVALTNGGPKSASEDLGPPTVGNCPELPYSTGKPVESHSKEP